jgi:hypothetical protein
MHHPSIQKHFYRANVKLSIIKNDDANLLTPVPIKSNHCFSARFKTIIQMQSSVAVFQRLPQKSNKTKYRNHLKITQLTK